ncbi:MULTISPECIES: ABC transporter ATP-binding protein [unclassified Nonomuraea]|uniref:ABC transporter ATP-binding protein n=1 Tax=unclassified Nonomuraea TaxID=2593643 RepID=UPI0035C041D1
MTRSAEPSRPEVPDPVPPAGPGFPVVLQHVSKSFGTGPTSVTALRDVSMAFPHATFTALMGPSGSGKSTFMHCAAGLERPDAGAVLLAGVDIAKLSENRLTVFRRESIGFVFQSFNLLPSLTARQNITLPFLLNGGRADAKWVDEIAERVGLAERMHHLPAELSGGQQQRVSIARALVTRPQVIFADEPTGALDTRAGRDVLRLLREAVDVFGRTLVMVTHDPRAAAYADRVVFLVDGGIVDEMTAPTAERTAAWLSRLEA